MTAERTLRQCFCLKDGVTALDRAGCIVQSSPKASSLCSPRCKDRQAWTVPFITLLEHMYRRKPRSPEGILKAWLIEPERLGILTGKWIVPSRFVVESTSIGEPSDFLFQHFLFVLGHVCVQKQLFAHSAQRKQMLDGGHEMVKDSAVEYDIELAECL